MTTPRSGRRHDRPDDPDRATGLRRRTLLSGAVVLGSGLLGGLGGMRSASAAAVAAPAITGCDEWGARPPSQPVVMVGSPPQKIIVHHTATVNSTDYSAAHAVTLAQSIQNYHMDHNGWIDTGQHLTVSRGGYVLEGRHRSLEALRSGNQDVESAHTYGQNSVAIGIENEGTYTSVDLRAEHYAALLELCTYLCDAYGIPAYQIYGHRDFNNTACPGDRLYGLLPGLRADVAARLGGDPTAPTWPVTRLGDSGERVRTVQYLLSQHGTAITVDGMFGSATDSAVRSFQSVEGATVDGIVGPQTWNQLVLPVGRGATGDAVRAVQGQLSAHGVATAVDGVFGPGTETSVRSFQSAAGLPADGLVDARTWSHLVG